MTRTARGTVRIIGGRWRGTRIPVADTRGLRPTADRVRETLFNWLAPVMPGARCLDLFAGSGALGFEAVSRGAAHATLIERDVQLAAGLEALRTRLDAHDVVIQRDDALAFLAGPPAPSDIVFVDPPFDTDLVDAVLERLGRGWLNEGAFVYVEHAIDTHPSCTGWQQIRSGHTRQVNYALLQASG